MYKKIQVSSSGTEWDFVKEWIDQFESCGFVCTNDKDELKDKMETRAYENIPIVFTHGNITFSFVRYNNFYSSSKEYTFTLTGNNRSCSVGVEFSLPTYDTTYKTTRKFSFDILAEENHVNITMYDYKNSFCSDIFILSMNNSVYFSKTESEGYHAIKQTLYSLDFPKSYDIHNALKFRHNEDNKLFFAQGVRYLDGDVFSMEDRKLIDCSTVTPKIVITIGEKKYFSLSPNVLIEVTGG